MLRTTKSGWQCRSVAAITPSFVSCTTGCWELSCQTTTFGWKQRDLKEGIIFRTSQCSTAWRASLRSMTDAPFCTRRCVQARWERLTEVGTDCMQSIDVCMMSAQQISRHHVIQLEHKMWNTDAQLNINFFYLSLSTHHQIFQIYIF